MNTIVELEGVNGTWFRLSGEGCGDQGVYLATDVDGIWDAPVQTIANAAAFQTGSDYGGLRNLHRDIVFGVVITDDNGNSWAQNDSEWRKAWAYDRDCRLWIETEESRRYLSLRLAQQPIFKPESDPFQGEVERVVMTCRAHNPWWWEDDVTDTWTSTIDTRPADPSSETGHKVQLGDVAVSNPTDNPIWLVWQPQSVPAAKALLPDFSFGSDEYDRADEDAARQIWMPGPSIANQSILVDTDPEARDGQVVTFLRKSNGKLGKPGSGEPLWAQMNGVAFLYSVPPYTPETQLPVGVSNAASGWSVQVRCRRPWSRPWGLE
ncbi:phage tail protein [Rhodococcus sp. D2-41]|uniref:phage tail protein n=1 Tax=Speluncibacter jeojiensis TaxID=2710754 RepID=UPI00240F1016|nr:phage tail protein [Rhodococcus sp. D2-41]MDG3012141.1 phage tail protein [Rhodococcus sp. D2-41]